MNSPMPFAKPLDQNSSSSVLTQFELVFVCRFAIAGLGFALAAADFGAVAAGLTAAFFGAPALVVRAAVRFSFFRATGFFAAADFGSSFFSVNSKAGLGSGFSCGPVRVRSAVGFTPAAAAAFAADAANTGCFGRPSISGLTMTWLS